MASQHTVFPPVVVPIADLVRGTTWLDIHQAGIYTSCKASTIRRACNRQELQHVRVGHARGPILTQAEWLDAWIMRGVQYPAVDDADGSDTVHESLEGWVCTPK